MTRRYLVILERGECGYGSFSPDLPGCVATGEMPEVTLSRVREAIASHVRGLREDGEPIPEPTVAPADWVSIDVA
jgi:predicted RNase H-like HicB family nuclease